MTEEIAELVNRLADIENEIAMLWDYHQDNPARINVEDRFNQLQRDASGIEDYLQVNGFEVEEEDELPF
jgi:PP-loop superfamily ATP-utilizing enzyme